MRVTLVHRVSLVGTVVLLLGASSAVGYIGYEGALRLVHPPRDLDPRTPGETGLAFQPVTLLTSDGLHLAAWWIPSAQPGPAPVVVFLHGYGASKAQALSVAPFLHRAGYAVLAFDFRAHGDSEGTYTTVGIDEVQDVRAALAWIDARPEQADASRVALFGWSMGAATAINAAAHGLPVRALVLDSPFASLDQVAANLFARATRLPVYPFAPVTFAFAQLMTHRSVDDDRPIQQASQVRAPSLVIQGLADDIIGPTDAAAVGHAEGGNATLWLVPGADHLGAVYEEPVEYQAHVLSFLARALS